METRNDSFVGFNFGAAYLVNAQFFYQNLTGANLCGANLSNAQFLNVEFQGVTMDSSTRWEGAIYWHGQHKYNPFRKQYILIKGSWEPVTKEWLLGQGVIFKIFD